MMTKKTDSIIAYINALYPDAKCELLYKHDYELVISVMLSSQTTDKKVNSVTSILFYKYPSLESLAAANVADIEKILRPLGMSNKKAIYVIEIAKRIIDQYKGTVPSSREELMSLAGVGNKTANVIRAEVFKIPEIPVDTHIERISKRLALVRKECNVGEIEKELKKMIPDDIKIRTHHQMIRFGRYICKAKNPQCKDCQLKLICSFYKKSI